MPKNSSRSRRSTLPIGAAVAGLALVALIGVSGQRVMQGVVDDTERRVDQEGIDEIIMVDSPQMQQREALRLQGSVIPVEEDAEHTLSAPSPPEPTSSAPRKRAPRPSQPNTNPDPIVSDDSGYVAPE